MVIPLIVKVFTSNEDIYSVGEEELLEGMRNLSDETEKRWHSLHSSVRKLAVCQVQLLVDLVYVAKNNLYICNVAALLQTAVLFLSL
jgi:hypothetical protein